MTMQKQRDELLVAYLDGELDARQRAEVEALLQNDGAARERLAQLREATSSVRAAFDEILREDVPERLIAAARGPAAQRGAEIVPFHGKQPAATWRASRHWWVAVPVAASLLGIVIGGGLGYLGVDRGRSSSGEALQTASNSTATNSWLDNAAEYHKLFVNASTANSSFADIPAKDGDGGEVMKKLSQRTGQEGVKAPNLKPWGLILQGARLIAVEGQTATQFIYTADDKTVGKAIGPLTVLIGATTRRDVAPTFDHRKDENLLYWRRKGHAYAIVGQADIGYMWGLANDIAWQLDAI